MQQTHKIELSDATGTWWQLVVQQCTQLDMCRFFQSPNKKGIFFQMMLLHEKLRGMSKDCKAFLRHFFCRNKQPARSDS